MSGDTTLQSLKRLSWLPDRDSGDNGNLIAGQEYYDVDFTGGSISNVTLTNVTINGTATVRNERVVTASGNVAVASDDYIITMNKTVGEITTITLPASPSTSRSLIIKDGKGDSSTFNITIDGNGKTIDGSASLVLDFNFQAIEIVYNGTEWNVIGSYGAAVDISDVSGLGANVAQFLGNPSSANLRSALTDETGNGAAYFQNGDLGTPSAGVATNLTGTAAGLTAGTASLASTITVADESSDTTCFPLFTTAATGSLSAKTNSGLSFNSSSGLLTTTSISSGVVTLTSTSAGVLVAGRNGAVDPVFKVNANTASAATGIEITGAAAGGGVDINAISSGANEDLNIRSKGTGNISLYQTSTLKMSVTANAVNFTPGTSSAASQTRFSFTGAADTSLSAGTEAPSVHFNMAQTRQHASNTAITLQRDLQVSGSTHTFVTAGGVITDCAAFAVNGPSNGGTNSTLTNSHAILVPTRALTNVTNGYGMTIVAPTGATNNYCAQFVGKVQNTITDTSTGTTTVGEVASPHYAFLNWSPPADTGAVRFASTGYAQHTTANSITGVGHYGGLLGYAQKNNATGTDELVIGVEGRVGALAGAITIGASVVGTFDTNVEDAGTITYGAAFYVPTQSDSGHITNKFAFWNNNSDWQVRTNGPIVCASATTGDQQVIPRTRGAVATNVYYPIEGVTGLFASTSHARNLAWAVPWICSEKVTWTRAGFTNGIGVASAVGRMGIYTDSSGRPGARIADFGTVTAGIADTGAREITISQTLEAGMYWLVLAIQGGATDNSITYASVNSWNTMGMTAPTAQDGTCYVAAAGALPDPFGAPTVTGAGFAPFLWMRKV